LNEVSLNAPTIFETFNMAEFDWEMNRWVESQTEQVTITSIWIHALALVHTMYGNDF
jgi:hypothetical protein